VAGFPPEERKRLAFEQGHPWWQGRETRLRERLGWESSVPER
jgi:hypothetical protein